MLTIGNYNSRNLNFCLCRFNLLLKMQQLRAITYFSFARSSTKLPFQSSQWTKNKTSLWSHFHQLFLRFELFTTFGEDNTVDRNKYAGSQTLAQQNTKQNFENNQPYRTKASSLLAPSALHRREEREPAILVCHRVDVVPSLSCW